MFFRMNILFCLWKMRNKIDRAGTATLFCHSVRSRQFLAQTLHIHHSAQVSMQAGTGMGKENAKIMLEVRLPNAKKGYNNSDTFIYKSSIAA